MTENVNTTRILEDKARSAGMSPKQAAEFVNSCDQFRTFREKLERYAGEGDLRSKLMAGLRLYHPEAKSDSLDRKVRMWINGQVDLALDRKTIKEFAFIFEFTVEQADSFLALMTDEGFRWRDPEDIISVFALNCGMDYLDAERLRKQIGEVKANADGSESNDENLTDLVRDEIMCLTTEEQLKAYLAENGNKFGKCRNRAWHLFMTFMERLKEPVLDENVQQMIEKGHLKPEKNKKTFAILKEYLHRELIPQGEKRASILNNKRLSKTQKAILKNILSAWPDENMLKNMENQKAPVSRKVLLMLFLALDEDPEEEMFRNGEDDFEISPEELIRDRYESRYSRMNLMLGSCGFRLLDPRNPFDWLILYSISVEDLFYRDQQMENMLEELFPGIAKK